MERRMIAPGFVEDALACLAAQGIEAAPLLRKVGLPAVVADPITGAEFGALWLAMAEAARDEFFGLGARPMRPGSFALMCQAALHTGTLGHALRRALRFLNVVLDEPQGRLVVQGAEAEVVLSSSSSAPRSAFAYRTYWLILLGLACWLIGRRIPLRQVEFACPAPAHRVDYRLFFGAPVHFDRKASRLSFDAAYLALPVIRSERALKVFLRGAPANLLVRYRHDAGLAGRLRAELRAAPPGQWPGVEEVAARFGLSPATLRRHLKAEGQGFAALRDEVRAVAAQRLLRESDRPIATIAVELGYSEPGAFHRAFRKWTGLSPGAFRAAAG